MIPRSWNFKRGLWIAPTERRIGSGPLNNHLGFGASLDLTHAFDSVDLSLMEKIIMDLLPLGCGCWCKLLFQQWKHMNRWIVFDKTVHPVALQVSHGVPQGDPAGPLIMNLLMSALMRIVDKRLQLSPSDFFHVLYMDDRTFIGKNKQDVQRAQEIWQ